MLSYSRNACILKWFDLKICKELTLHPLKLFKDYICHIVIQIWIMQSMKALFWTFSICFKMCPQLRSFGLICHSWHLKPSPQFLRNNMKEKMFQKWLNSELTSSRKMLIGLKYLSNQCSVRCTKSQSINAEPYLTSWATNKPTTSIQSPRQMRSQNSKEQEKSD